MDIFSIVLAVIFTISWNIIKGLFLIVVVYYFYQWIASAVEFVWDIVHPRSLQAFKNKFKKKEDL
ncbi:MAG: hypothetical protein ABS939_13755 [Psychrobacillus sp.]